MGSLRTRILAGYVLVVAFSLFLASAVALALLVDYQQRATLARRRALAATVAADLAEWAGGERTGLPAEALQRLRLEASALGARFLLTDGEGRVLQDTGAGSSLVGQRVRLAGKKALRDWWRMRAPDGQSFLVTSVPLQRAAAREAGEPPKRYLVLAVAPEDVRQAWRDMLVLLAGAGLLAMAASLAAAFFLSRSITRPLAALTQAIQAVARGHYEQRVPVEGQDEFAQLGQGFNAMAEQVERSRQTERDLLANITHDLRTPLTSIQGFSQALLEGTADDPESRREAASIIHEEAARMDRLIDDLLDLARLEAGVADMRHERLEPGPLLEGLAAAFGVRAEAAGLTFQAELAEPLPPVRGDAGRLEQAIGNLLANAVRYTPPGGRIALSARGVLVRRGQAEPPLPGRVVVGHGPLKAGLWLAIAVQDTGRGIAPEDVGRIFERFYRADKSRTEAAGSGLGLSIVREIVLAHGGLVAVRSAPGQGATFTMLLPGGEAEPSNVKSQTSSHV